jgi:hypothetical protein
MFRDDIFNHDIASGRCCCKHKGSGFDLVRNNGILCPVKLLNTADTDHIGTGTFDIGTHAVQEVRNIDNVRLTC